jgi:hypothetical protein
MGFESESERSFMKEKEKKYVKKINGLIMKW